MGLFTANIMIDRAEAAQARAEKEKAKVDNFINSVVKRARENFQANVAKSQAKIAENQALTNEVNTFLDSYQDAKKNTNTALIVGVIAIAVVVFVIYKFFKRKN